MNPYKYSVPIYQTATPIKWPVLKVLMRAFFIVFTFIKGRISRFSACLYTDWPVHAFWHRPRFFIVYEPIVSKLPNFACK